MSNHAAATFQKLESLWQKDICDQGVEVLVSELAALAAHGSVCLGLRKADYIPKLYGLVFFLSTYGLMLLHRYREEGDAVWIWLELWPKGESEFAGTVVRERLVAPERLAA